MKRPEMPVGIHRKKRAGSLKQGREKPSSPVCMTPQVPFAWLHGSPQAECNNIDWWILYSQWPQSHSPQTRHFTSKNSDWQTVDEYWFGAEEIKPSGMGKSVLLGSLPYYLYRGFVMDCDLLNFAGARLGNAPNISPKANRLGNHQALCISLTHLSFLVLAMCYLLVTSWHRKYSKLDHCTLTLPWFSRIASRSSSVQKLEPGHSPLDVWELESGYISPLDLPLRGITIFWAQSHSYSEWISFHLAWNSVLLSHQSFTTSITENTLRAAHHWLWHALQNFRWNPFPCLFQALLWLACTVPSLRDDLLHPIQ